MSDTHKRLQSFFSLLDKYLIGDLKTMVEEIEPRESGGLGYSSMQVILSGMELLGFVISGGKNNEQAFNYFWDEYFIKTNPAYDNPRLKKIFRHSVRNGTAHYFLVKFGVQISKSDVGNLGRTKDGLLNIDVVTVYKDFKTSYQNLKANLLQSADGELKRLAIKGLNKLVADLEASAVEVRQYLDEQPDQTKAVRSMIGDSITYDEAYGSVTPVTISGTSFPSITRIPSDMLEERNKEL